MNAALISLGSVSSKWTAEAMKEVFDSVDTLDIRKVEINIGAKKDASLLYEGKPIGNYDCIYAKGSFRYASLLRAVTGFMQDTTYMPIKDNAFTLAHNKLLTHLVLSKADIPMPITYLTPTPKAAKKLLERVNYPIVMKFPEGTQGRGVMFADSFSSASSLLDALESLNQPFIIQEYVETGSTDIRAIVVGDKVVASMQRIAVHGEKRANIHAGGMGEAVELDTHTKKMAVSAAHAIGTEICGVDILHGIKGPTVVELNLSPGLQGIKSATGKNVAKYIAKHLANGTSKFKGQDDTSKQSEIFKDLGLEEGKASTKEIVASLNMRGDRLILPGIASKLSGLDDSGDVILKISRNKLVIEKV